MLITDITTRRLRVPFDPPIADAIHKLEFADWIEVTVHTKRHTGSCVMLTFDFAPAMLRGFVDTELKRRVVGLEADDIGKVFETNLLATEYVGQYGLAMWGTSAIDTALWDLLAKRLDTPAATLFGRHTDTVPVYGSGGWLSWTDEQLADSIDCYLKRGFRGVKVKIGGPSEDRDIERVKAVRQKVGPEIDIMVDANQTLTYERAARFLRKTEDCNLRWLEEPFKRDDLESYKRLAQNTETPLAMGEREFGCEHFRRMIAAGAIHVVQPDLLRIGGVTMWREVASLADAFRLRIAPHLYKEYDVHLAAAWPSTVAIEWFDWLDPLLTHPLQIRDGRALVPQTPGFGVEFTPEAVREYGV